MRRAELLWSTALAAGAAATAAASLALAYVTHPAVPLTAAAAVAFAALALAHPAWALSLALAALWLDRYSVAGLSPTEAGLLVVAAAYVARALVAPDSVVLPRGRDVPIALLLGAIAAGLLDAFELFPVARTAVLWTAFALVYLQVQSFGTREIALVVTALAVGTGIVGALGAASFLESGAATQLYAGGLETGVRAVGSFADPNYYASMLVLGLLPALALLSARPPRAALLLPAIVGGGAGLALSLSRGAMLGFAAGVVLLVLWGRARRLAVLGAIGLAALVLTGAGPASEGPAATVAQRLSTIAQPRSETNSRPEAWRAAVDMAADRPLTGIGVNQFERKAAEYGALERGQPLENAHSIPFSLLAETGLIGFGAFALLCAMLAARALRALEGRGLARALAAGIAAALVAFLVQGLTVVQLRTPTVAAGFFVLAGLLTALADRQGRPIVQPGDTAINARRGGNDGEGGWSAASSSPPSPRSPRS